MRKFKFTLYTLLLITFVFFNLLAQVRFMVDSPPFEAGAPFIVKKVQCLESEGELTKNSSLDNPKIGTFHYKLSPYLNLLFAFLLAYIFFRVYLFFYSRSRKIIFYLSLLFFIIFMVSYTVRPILWEYFEHEPPSEFVMLLLLSLPGMVASFMSQVSNLFFNDNFFTCHERPLATNSIIHFWTIPFVESMLMICLLFLQANILLIASTIYNWLRGYGKNELS